jgi:hypothetical protein
MMQSQRTTNVVPVIAGPLVKNVEQSQWVQLSTFLSVNDADADPMVRFEVRDNNATAGSGHLWYAGNVLTAGQVVQANTGDLSTLWTRGGTNTSTDAMEIRAFDGIGWSDWKSFALVTRLPNRAPVITPAANPQGVGTGLTVAASSLINATDADDDPIAAYKIWDPVGGGRFEVNGTPIAAGQWVEVSAADFVDTVYRGGVTQGSEPVWVLVNDGTLWSTSSATWTMQSQRTTNVAPVIAGPLLKNVEQSQWLQLSTFLSVSDADADPMVRFEVRDNNAAAGSGVLWYAGANLVAGQVVQVNTGDLSTLWARGGANTGTDAMEIRAFDGIGWSEWKSFNLVTRLPNLVPVVTPTESIHYLPFGVVVPAGSLFSAMDPNGEAITQYEFWHNSGGGQFLVNGVGQPAGQAIGIAPADLDKVTYQAGFLQETETVFVRANDGTAWSPWAQWSMASGPQGLRMGEIVGTRGNDFRSTSPGNIFFGLKGDDNISGSGGAMGGEGNDTYNVQFGESMLIYDTGNSPNDVLNMSNIDIRLLGLVDERHLALISSNLHPNPDFLQIFAVAIVFDYASSGMIETISGQSWQQFAAQIPADNHFTWAELELGAGLSSPAEVAEFMYHYRRREAALQVDSAPVVAARSPQPDIFRNNSYAVSQFFTASDANGDPIVSWELTDLNAGNGTLLVNGVAQQHGTPVTVFDLAGVTYQAPGLGGSDTLRVRASDGGSLSAPVDIPVVTVNHLPVVSAQSASPREGEEISVGSLFTAADADGDPIVTYQITDTGAGGATLLVNGQVQPVNVPVTVAAADLGTVRYLAGASAETLDVRAHDGIEWGPVTHLSVVPRANAAPVANAINAIVFKHATVDGTNGRERLSILIAAGDSNGDPLVQWEFTDPVGHGRIVVNGVEQPEGTPFLLTQAQYLDAWYVAGDVIGPETVTGRASDGLKWSNTASATLTTQLNTLPVVTKTDASLVHATGLLPLSNMFSASDANGGTLVYEVRKLVIDNLGFGGSANSVRNEDGYQIANLNSLAFLGITSLAPPAADITYVVSARASDGVDWSPWVDANLTVFAERPESGGNDAENGRHLTLTSEPQTFHDWIGGQNTPVFDFQDWYIFALPQGGAVHLDITGNTEQLVVSPQKLQADHSNGGFIPGVGSFGVPSGGLLPVGADFILDPLGSGWYYALRISQNPGVAGTYYDISLSVTANAVPRVVAEQENHVMTGQTVQASTLFYMTVPDGEPITGFRFTDHGTDESSGYFELHGVRLPSGQPFELANVDVPDLLYVRGAVPGSEMVSLAVSDPHQFGPATNWMMTTP